jgi:hypothetical protein
MTPGIFKQFTILLIKLEFWKHGALAINSASALDWAAFDWRLEYQHTGPFPRKLMWPLLEYRVLIHPPQSLSQKLVK